LSRYRGTTRNPTIEDVAKDLGMSVRVLQKKLKEEGATFSEIAANVRQELAKSYLAEKRYTIDDITYLLGFSEPGVFRRAFKMWTGMTPVVNTGRLQNLPLKPRH
jgi:AraC-like DNA-binding protein